MHQLPLNGFDGSDDAGIGARQETDEGHQKQGGIELLRPIGLHEAVFLRAKGA